MRLRSDRFQTGWIVAAAVLPPPGSVGARFVQAWTDGTMERHVPTTLSEIVLGFGAGAALGVIVGYVLARSRFAERLLSPYIVAAQATPVLAIAPLLALWFGTGLLSKVIICSLIVFFPIAVATMVGIRSVDADLLEMCRAFRARPVLEVTPAGDPHLGAPGCDTGLTGSNRDCVGASSRTRREIKQFCDRLASERYLTNVWERNYAGRSGERPGRSFWGAPWSDSTGSRTYLASSVAGPFRRQRASSSLPS